MGAVAGARSGSAQNLTLMSDGCREMRNPFARGAERWCSMVRVFERQLYTSRSGAQYWMVNRGPDGDYPVVLEWGSGVGLVADRRYAPIYLTTAEPGQWRRDRNRHVLEIISGLDGGGVLFDENGSITVWIREDMLRTAVFAFRNLYGPCVHGSEIVRLNGLLGTKLVRVESVSADGTLQIEVSPEYVEIQAQPTFSKIGDCELPPKAGSTDPRLREIWEDSIGAYRYIVPREARIAIIEDVK